MPTLPGSRVSRRRGHARSSLVLQDEIVAQPGPSCCVISRNHIPLADAECTWARAHCNFDSFPCRYTLHHLLMGFVVFSISERTHDYIKTQLWQGLRCIHQLCMAECRSFSCYTRHHQADVMELKASEVAYSIAVVEAWLTWC